MLICQRLIQSKEGGEWNTEDFIAATAIIRSFSSRYKIELPNFTPDISATQLFQGLTEHIASRQAKLYADAFDKEISEAIDLYENQVTKDSFGYAVLDETEKTIIHSKIANIREIIEKSDLSDRKKNALFDRLSNLIKEVDRNGTKTDAFFAFAGDLAFVARDFHENSKPLISDFKDILKIVMRDRAKKEGIELPGPEDFPALPTKKEIDESNS